MTDVKTFKIKFFQGFTAKQIIEKDQPVFEHHHYDSLYDKRSEQGIVYIQTEDFDLDDLCKRLQKTKDMVLVQLAHELKRVESEFDYLYAKQLKKKALTGDWVEKL